LKVILGRTEKGEGLLGEVTSNSERGRELGSNLGQTLRQLSATLVKINSGRTLAGRVLADEKYGKENGDALQHAIASAAKLFGTLSEDVEKGNGALPALLGDPEGKKKVYALIDNLSQAGVSLARVSADLDKGRGLLPVLLHDETFATNFRQHLDGFALHLDSISQKLDRGDGTLGMLINDPALYDAANDIVVGINDSKTLKWLIRNRQNKGINDRYNHEIEKQKHEQQKQEQQKPVPDAGSHP
jgi:phospholipid/cholesterol/gamma-HCH transport system substrate-binding protein